VLAGGGDQLGTLVWGRYNDLRALAGQRGGADWCSPYDIDRSGIVLGEGAAMLVLESPETARRRGAEPYALIENDISFGVPSSLYDWPTEAEAAVPILHEFLSRTGAVVDAVFGSANSSRGLDQFEANVLTRLFGEAAAAVAVTSIKGAIGEFGGAGALTAAAAVLALRDRIVPPLCHLRKPIECALCFAGASASAKPLRRVLQLSAARGGAMSAISFRGATV
jgi:3-oxoacyl-(acyl-carrier-protein) synthase